LGVAYLVISDKSGFLMIRQYHLAADGWGGLAVLKELGEVYNKMLANEELSSEPGISYMDFVTMEHDYLASKSFQDDIVFLVNLLNSLPPVLFSDNVKATNNSTQSRRIYLPVNRQLFNSFTKLLADSGVGIAAGAVSLLFICLSRYTGRPDVVIGMPVLNRRSRSLREIVGHFTHLLPVIENIDPNTHVSEVIQSVNRSLRTIFRHSSCPVSLAKNELEKNSSGSGLLFDVTFNHLTNRLGVNYGGHRSVVHYATNLYEPRTLGISICEFDDEEDVGLYVDYDIDRFNEDEIYTFAKRLLDLMAQYVSEPSMLCSDFKYLEESAVTELRTLGTGPAISFVGADTMHGLFESIVAEFGDSDAVYFNDKSLTYKQLDQQANNLANILLAKGLGKEDRVAVMGVRSEKLIVAMLGILKAGCVYVPIDPFYPKDRITWMLSDSQTSLVIDLMSSDVILPVDVIRPEEYADGSNTNPNIDIRSTDAAYMIYTSGSTGTPKGVVVEHGGFVNMIRSQILEFNVASTDSVLLFASPSFDASLSEAFMGLGAGACLYPVSREQVEDPWGLRAYIETHSISVVTFPPSYLRIYEQADFPTLKVMITAGESANPSDAIHYASRLAYFNAYGPTECSVCATIGRVYPDDYMKNISIGRPIHNTRIYIMDSNGGLLPCGTVGELCAAGIGLARGYWNRPEITSEKFIPDPFVPGDRIYRTGDRARWLPDGRIEYLGRLDDQSKVHGYRIEPGEISLCAEALPGIRQAVALIDSVNGESSLLLFVVGNATKQELREHLQDKLPAYMLPHQIIEVDSIPMTPNGKVDRKALLQFVVLDESESGDTYLAPANELESQIVSIWKEVLGRSPIGTRDNFFQIGGDSIQAMKVCGRLQRQVGKSPSLRQFFDTATVSGLATLLDTVYTSKTISVTNDVLLDELIPLTHAQQQIWFAQSVDKTSPAYNMPFALEIESNKELDENVLESALNTLISRHESLRISFTEVDGYPRQTINKSVDFRLEKFDVSSEESARGIATNMCATPFDLTQAPLLRAGLIRMPAKRCILILCLHHIVGDGVSLAHLIDELFSLMDEVPLPVSESMLGRIIRADEQYLQNRNAELHREYWRDKLQSIEPLTDLPTDYPHPSYRTYNGDRTALTLSHEMSKALNDLAYECRTSPFAVFLGLVQVFLHKYSSHSDITVGIPASMREHYNASEWVGYLVNPIAVRTVIDGKESLSEFIRHLHGSVLDGLDKSAYPFDLVVDSLEMHRDPSHSPLFDVMVVSDDLDPAVWSVNGRKVYRFDIDFKIAKFDLTFTIASRSVGETQLMIEYNTDIFTAKSADQMLKHLAVLIKSASSNAEAPIDSLEVLDTTEKSILLALSHGPEISYTGANTMHGLFESAALIFSDSDAVQFNGKCLTYKQLDQQANILANILLAKGLDKEDRIAVLGLRSDKLVIAMLGILKAGCVYVPIDPAYPKDRILWMLSDSQASAVVDLVNTDIDLPVTVIHPEDYENGSDKNPCIDIKASDAAYMIYTSGSTGTPKGVIVEHGGFVNMIRSQMLEFNIQPGDGVLLFASPSFDASLSEVFMGLGAGACLYPVTREQVEDPWGLRTYIEDHGISVATFPPSYLRVFEHADFSTLNVMITAGESANPSDAKHYASLLAYFNAYGPTECSVCATIGRVETTDDSRNVSIGKPIANTRTYILDSNEGLLSYGVAGELCIAGAGLARGYWNRPEITSEKFVADPFVPGDRMYRTGDRAKWLDDGRIEFLGRLDEQSKVRGYRVEPGEISICAETLHGIRQAVALIDSVNGESSLLLFVVGEVVTQDLRRHLQEKLPAYMIPQQIIEVDSIPMTPNGKVDHKALLGLAVSDAYESCNAYKAPANEIESQIVSVWEEVLGKSPIGISDNFFQIGGDSIQAMRVCSRLRAFDLAVTSKQIFTHPTIAELAQVISKAEIVSDTHPKAVTEEPFALTPIQHWFMEKPSANEPFVQATYLIARERLVQSAMHAALEAVADHHDALRLRFIDHYTQQYTDTPSFTWVVEDLTSITDYNHRISEIASGLIKNLNAATGVVFGAAFLHLDTEDRVYLLAHHLVVDAYSWQVILEDLATAYDLALNEKEIKLPAKSSSYRAWSDTLAEYSKINNESTYWQGICNASSASLPTAGEADSLCHGDLVRITAELDADVTAMLLGSGNQPYRTETVELLLAGLAEGLGKCNDGKIYRVLYESHGRELIDPELDLSRSVGWFTALFPVLLDTSSEMTIKDRIRNTKERFRRVPNKGIGYGVLRYLNDASGLQPTPQLVFNYLGQMRNQLGDGLLSLSMESPADTVSPGFQHDAPIVFTTMVIGDRLQILIDYHPDVLTARTAESFLNETVDSLKSIVKHTSQRQSWELMPSDCAAGSIKLTEFDNLLATIGVQPTDVEDILPLTPSQEAMMYSYIASPASRTYFQQFRINFFGRIQPELMELAWLEVAKRHQSLRSVFQHETLESPVQIVMREAKILFVCEEFGANVDDIAARDLDEPFDLSHSPTMRIRLVETTPDHWTLLWSFHHILMDGWCLAIVFGDLFKIYESLSREQSPDLPPAPSLRAFTDWIDHRDRSASEAFWSDFLAGYDTPVTIPHTAKSRNRSGYHNCSHTLKLTREETNALVRVSASQGITLSTLFQTAWGTVLAKYNDTNDVVFGVVVSGRPSDVSSIESTVGAFIMTVPCRVNLEPCASFVNVSKRLQNTSLASEPHQWLSLAAIQANSPLQSNLLDHILVFENYPLDKNLLQNPLSGIEIDSIGAVEQIPYELGITVVPGDEIDIRFAYNANAYDDRFIATLGMQLRQMLSSIASDPMAAMDSLPVITHEDAELFNVFNSTDAKYPVSSTIHDLIFAQAKLTPGRKAIIIPAKDSEIVLTYADLIARSHALSKLLDDVGVTHGRSVAVLLDRDEHLIPGLLAVLSRGAAYIPLDPLFPMDRLRYILEDSGASVVLTERNLLDALGDLSHLSINVILVDNYDLDSVDTSKLNHPEVQPDDVAYTIYTSGSTGKPKGVEITHRNVVNFMYSMLEEPGLSIDDHILAVTTVSFDIAGLELFLPLLCGASTILAGRSDTSDPDRLISLLDTYNITMLQATPATWRMLIDNGWQGKTNLRMLVGGEALHSSLAAVMLSRGKELWNMYGPTETTIWSTLYQVDPADLPEDDSIVSIGKPIANTQVFVIAKQGDLLPKGAVGELIIGGDGVGNGYHQRSELTAEKFVRLPAISDGVLYKTGDLVSWNADGNLDYHGRIDFQVKLRGFRIELGEIESVLQTHSSVREAVVMCTGSTENKQLAAYVLGCDASSIDQLRSYVREALPEYMVPSIYIPMDVFPLTPNGKVDRKKLETINADKLSITDSTDFEPPYTPTEIQLAQLFRKILNIDRVGRGDNFLNLGGHSLRAVTLMNMIRREMGASVSLAQILQAQSLADLAQTIDRSSGSSAIQHLQDTDRYPLSYAQRGLWALQYLDPDNAAYNIPMAVMLKGPLDVKLFETALMRLIDRHESLRTRFVRIDDKPWQVVDRQVESVLKYTDISDESDHEDIAKTRANEEAMRPFDLESSYPLRMLLLKTGPDTHVFIATAHHIAFDGWSMHVFFKELGFLYEHPSESLPPLTIQYRDFASWQVDHLSGDDTDRRYWLQKLGDDIDVLNIQTDHPRPKEKTYNGSRLLFAIGADGLSRLQNLSKSANTSLFASLTSLVTVLLHRYSGSEDIVLGTAVAGREYADLEDQIGMYVNTVALRNQIESDVIFMEFLDRTSHTVEEAFRHQGYPFDLLVDDLKNDRDLSRSPIFDVMVTMQNLPQVDLPINGLQVTPLLPELPISKFDLSFTFTEEPGQIACELEFNTDLFELQTIEHMADHFSHILNSVLDDPYCSVGNLIMISDEEKQKVVVEFNDTLKSIEDTSIVPIFERTVTRYADQTAVLSHNRIMTYSELDQLSKQYAQSLTGNGIYKGNVVGVAMNRSIDHVAAFYGTLRAGCVYLPLNLDYPDSRLRYMVEDSGCELIIANPDSSDRFAGFNIPVLSTDEPTSIGVDIFHQQYPGRNDIAYIIYTSGSTGEPKGVRIEHSSLANYVQWATGEFGLVTGDVTLPLASISFDASISELVYGLAGGSALALAPPGDERAPAAIAAAIAKHSVTSVQMTPSLLGAFFEYIRETDSPDDLSTLRLVLSGGERLSSDLVMEFNRMLSQPYGTRLCNVYGPTETTVDAASYWCDISDEIIVEIPIGHPVANTKIYILEKNGQPVPIGVPGEICVAGVSVAKDYLNHPDLTAKNFTQNPFDSSQRMYRTGDLGKWRSDGNVEMLGRIDQQIKLRGYRIELGEIESALRSLTGIRNAAVVLENEPAHLLAYLVVDKEIDVSQLRTQLQVHLPEYMVPSTFRTVDKIPMNQNGKVDYKKLQGSGNALKVAKETRLVSNDIEESLLSIWQEILETTDEIGVEDSFFEIGGNSLLLVRLHAAIERQWPGLITATDLFKFTTISAQANALS